MRAHFLVGFFATLADVALVALIGLWRGGVMFSSWTTFTAADERSWTATVAVPLAGSVSVRLE